jgi:hypothetical protein
MQPLNLSTACLPAWMSVRMNWYLVIRKNGKPFDPQKYANTRSDRARLINKLLKLPGHQGLFGSHRYLPFRSGDCAA